MSSKIRYQTIAIKCAFIGTDGKSYVYEYQGGTYTDKANWLRVDGEAVNEQKETVEGFKSDLNTFKQGIEIQITDNVEKVDKSLAASLDLTQKVNGRINYDDLSLSARQIIESKGGGTINNQADEEDITVVDGKLKEADKAYNPVNFSGRGRKILRKNILADKNQLTQEMLSLANTCYIIRYDFDLNGSVVRIPDNSSLVFEGGKLTNGTVDFNNCEITGYQCTLFDNIKHVSTPRNTTLTAEWFGINTNSQDNSDNLQYLIESQGNVLGNFKTIKFASGIYRFRKEVRINGVILEGAYPCINMDFRHYSVAQYGYLHTIFQFIPSDYGNSIDYTHIQSKEELSSEREIVFLKSQAPNNSSHCGGFVVMNINFVCGNNPKDQTVPNKNENVTCIECRNTITIKDCIIRHFNTAVRKFASQYTIVDGLILVGCCNGIYLKHQTGDPLDTTFYINRLSCSYVDVVINTLPSSPYYQANVCSDLRITDVTIQACRVFIMNYDRHLASVVINNLYTEANTNPDGIYLIQYVLSQYQRGVGATNIPNLTINGAYCVTGKDLIYAEIGNIQIYGGTYYLKDNSIKLSNKHISFLRGCVSLRLLGASVSFDGDSSFIDTANLDEQSKSKIWILSDDTRNGGVRYNSHVRALHIGNEWKGCMISGDENTLSFQEYEKNNLYNRLKFDYKNQVIVLSDKEDYKNDRLKNAINLDAGDYRSVMDILKDATTDTLNVNSISLVRSNNQVFPAVIYSHGVNTSCNMLQPVMRKTEKEISAMLYYTDTELHGMGLYNVDRNEIHVQGSDSNRYKIQLLPQGTRPFEFVEKTGLPEGAIFFRSSCISVVNQKGVAGTIEVRISELPTGTGDVTFKLPGKDYTITVSQYDTKEKIYRKIAGAIVHAQYHAYYDLFNECVFITAELTTYSELDSFSATNVTNNVPGLRLTISIKSKCKPVSWVNFPAILCRNANPEHADVNGVINCNSNTHDISWYHAGKWYDAAGNQSGALRTGTTAERPEGVKTGFAYKDTTIGKWVFWDGSRWELSDGTQA